MTPKARDRHRRVLLALRDRIGGRGPAPIEPARASPEATGADEDAQALNEMHQSLASTRNRDAAATLSRVDRALRKLSREPEEFGVCEECGEELPEGRLTAVPYAERCVDCQNRLDGPRGRVTRRSAWDF